MSVGLFLFMVFYAYRSHGIETPRVARNSNVRDASRLFPTLGALSLTVACGAPPPSKRSPASCRRGRAPLSSARGRHGLLVRHAYRAGRSARPSHPRGAAPPPGARRARRGGSLAAAQRVGDGHRARHGRRAPSGTARRRCVVARRLRSRARDERLAQCDRACGLLSRLPRNGRGDDERRGHETHDHPFCPGVGITVRETEVEQDAQHATERIELKSFGKRFAVETPPP